MSNTKENSFQDINPSLEMVEAASNQEQEVKYNNELFRRFIRTYHLTKQWEDFIKENPLERENPILDVDIRNVDMSVRLLNVLLYHSSRENITTLRDIVLIGKKRISRIRNLGTKSLNELEKILEDNNLCWESTNERKLPF
jgi:DNA-directed RNA polymerase alpha subunit